MNIESEHPVDDDARPTTSVTQARAAMAGHEAEIERDEQAAGATAALALHDVHVYYGNIHALKGLSLHVDEGEIVTIIGANGAGKSTTLKTISGLLRPRTGTVHHGDTVISGVPVDRIVARGIVHCPEGRRIFADLTVGENLDMGAFLRRDTDAIAHDREMVFALFPRLHERLKQRGGTLSGGEQQMLAIARAIMSAPKILMLDEPSLGLAPLLVQQIFAVIKRLNEENGLTILLVEQNAAAALRAAHRAYVMETGSITLSGPASELAQDPAVREAYLGG